MVLYEIGQSDPPLETIESINDYTMEHKFKVLINVRLASEDPAEYPQDCNHTANRVAEAAVAGFAYPRVKILLDTFMDHDRGYFPRIGLYDRRLNPRRVALVLRHINSAINTYGSDITRVTKQIIGDWTTITFNSQQTTYCLNLPNHIEVPINQMEPNSIDLVYGTMNSKDLPEGTQHLTIKSI